MEQLNTDSAESFRDSIATVDKQGKRVWLYPKKPGGRYTNWRNVVGMVLLAFLFVGPFIRIGGEPLLMIQVIERRFVLFGQTFWPQDIHLFVLAFIALIVFIALFTVVFGRLFCGWVCPQTIFMELVFRRIEYWIEGDRNHQIALNKAPWTTEKVLKKSGKHAIFLGIAFLISHTFLAYIIGTEELFQVVSQPPAANLAGFIALMVFMLAFYGVFAFLREQVCTTICPYGRLQGVLLDRDSVVIAYDRVRGEKRSSYRKGEDRAAVGKGDCIDCNACVVVCPTGIDIRNGTQLECVNCTACIDACDHIMDRIEKPRGLIRYASENGIVEKRSFSFTMRMKAYTAVLLLLVGVMVALIVTRSDVEATVLRTPGTLYQKQDDGRISNLYQYRLVNKTSRDMPIRMELLDARGEVRLAGRDIMLERSSQAEGQMFIILDAAEVKGMKNRVRIGVYSGDKLLEEITALFTGPMPGTS
ncbi:MAG: cytochrome c oxidase accessory protein CcoG [Flavobacteriales bacterium]|nr:cytochrome c oxidase accessory protein CcoG [Flavobacteriales bacterium]